MYDTNEHIGPRAMKYFIDKQMTPYFESIGLTAACGPFIVELQRHDGASMKELATYVMVDKSMATRVCRQLIKEGIVKNKSKSPHRYSLTLTNKGDKTANEINMSMKKIMTFLTEDLTPEEKIALKNINEKIKIKILESANDEHLSRLME